jgi:hypothetical protein
VPRPRPRPALATRPGAGLALVLALAGCASLAPSAQVPAEPSVAEPSVAEPSVAAPSATVSPTPSPGGAPAAGLLAVELVGGLCPTGDECRSVVTLDADGSWRSEDHTGAGERGTVDDDVLAQISDAVATADRDRLTATPFTGECERHMDGTELVLTLRPGAADELVLPSCTYALPHEGPLVDAVLALREATA